MRKIYFFAWVLFLFLLSVSGSAHTRSGSEANASKATATVVTIMGKGGFTNTGITAVFDINYSITKFPPIATKR
ncbi:MAG TPA: hypothetical protein VGQ09_22360 [Chitinophagaceae bacterium]|nr:hypothetical protein [Chitinophagaceae bacterium]